MVSVYRTKYRDRAFVFLSLIEYRIQYLFRNGHVRIYIYNFNLCFEGKHISRSNRLHIQPISQLGNDSPVFDLEVFRIIIIGIYDIEIRHRSITPL